MKFELAHRNVPARTSSADRALILAREDSLLLAVADGAGNSACGAEAAQAFVAFVAAQAGTLSGDALLNADFAEWLRTFDLPRADGGETTGMVLVIGPDRFARGASVGDSEARAVGAVGEACVLTENQRRKPLLGSGRAVPVSFQANVAERVLVAGSDGLFKALPASVLDETARSDATPEQMAESLLQRARLPSGGFADDVALIVCRMAATCSHERATNST